jgi:hypothetical protein
MKACSAALASHLAGDTTTLAYLWKLTPASATAAGGAPPPAAYVQSTHAMSAPTPASSVTITATLPNPTKAGNTIVAVAMVNSYPHGFVFYGSATVTDSQANSYDWHVVGGVQYTAPWVGTTTAKAGTLTVTVNASTSAPDNIQYWSIYVAEYVGVGSLEAFNVVDTSSATGTLTAQVQANVQSNYGAGPALLLKMGFVIGSSPSLTWGTSLPAGTSYTQREAGSLPTTLTMSVMDSLNQPLAVYSTGMNYSGVAGNGAEANLALISFAPYPQVATYVQSAHALGAPAPAPLSVSVPVTLPNPVTAGNSIVVLATVNSFPSGFYRAGSVTVTDSQGNTYSGYGPSAGDYTGSHQGWATAQASSPLTVTVALAVQTGITGTPGPNLCPPVSNAWTVDNTFGQGQIVTGGAPDGTNSFNWISGVAPTATSPVFSVQPNTLYCVSVYGNASFTGSGAVLYLKLLDGSGNQLATNGAGTPWSDGLGVAYTTTATQTQVKVQLAYDIQGPSAHGAAYQVYVGTMTTGDTCPHQPPNGIQYYGIYVAEYSGVNNLGTDCEQVGWPIASGTVTCSINPSFIGMWPGPSLLLEAALVIGPAPSMSWNAGTPAYALRESASLPSVTMSVRDALNQPMATAYSTSLNYSGAGGSGGEAYVSLWGFMPWAASAPSPAAAGSLGFTTHDQDIIYPPGAGAVTYQAETGMTNSASKSGSDLSTDNLEVTAFLESDSITEADILAGKYDNSDVEVRLVNWADLSMGDVLLRKGTVGVVKMKNGIFTAELLGLTHRLTAQIGSSYGPICRATFGSGLNGIDMTSHYKCLFDVTTIRQNASVTAVLDHHTIMPSALSPPPGSGAAPTSSGAKFPGTVAQAHRQNDWTNLAKVTASDGQYATATLYGSNAQVNEASLLQATNFGFSVPTGATIVGVLAVVQRQHFAGTSAVYDDTVTLLGTGGSADRRNASPWSPGPAPSGERTVNYGGPADTWGTALTPAVVNAAGFGIQLGCECTQLPGSGADVGIDSVTMTVFYTGAGTTAPSGWFDDGFMTFTSGVLSGAAFEVKTWDGQNIALFLPMPVLPAVGDTFWIEPGCNKTTDCQGKYNNIVNFRGEPFIPGMDQLLDYASA